MNDTEAREVNVPLLRKAVEWAETEAAKPNGQWNQSVWWESQGAGCGTAYCIAGWTCYADGQSLADGFTSILANGDFVDEHAQAVLGLSDAQAAGLFAAGNSIEDVRRIAEEIAGERL